MRKKKGFTVRDNIKSRRVYDEDGNITGYTGQIKTGRISGNGQLVDTENQAMKERRKEENREKSRKAREGSRRCRTIKGGKDV